MIGSLLSLLFVFSSLEVERGFSIETKGTSTFFDTEDSSSIGGGVRLSYIFTNPSDSFISFELDSSFERIFQKDPKYRWIAGANLSANEFYGPFAFRLAFGGLIEARASTYSPGVQYRFGLGYFWSSKFGNYIDYGNRLIFLSREDIRSSSYLDLSFVFVF
jgi:hypothetical protein